MAFRQYSNSKGSIGLIMYILYDIYGILESDHWQYTNTADGGVIKHGNTTVGTFTWNNDQSWAIFEFNDVIIKNRIAANHQNKVNQL